MAELLDATCTVGSCKHSGTYEMPGSCSNCGADYTVRLSKGHERPSSWLGLRCPKCGCSRVGCYTPIP